MFFLARLLLSVEKVEDDGPRSGCAGERAFVVWRRAPPRDDAHEFFSIASLRGVVRNQ